MLKQIRQLHLYLGTFFAPAIIFFSLTGALQTFSLHETAGAPAWIAKLAMIHKNQRLATDEAPRGPRPERAAAKPAAAVPQAVNATGATLETAPAGQTGAEEAAPPGAPRGPSPLPLKIFVLCMAIGLVTTTILGVTMAFKYNRSKKLVWGLLIAGAVLPLLLLFV